ncbi:PAS domain S-box protein, partial [Verrucomicrobiales bacterium]|nr:PAS domain S-box protein [Verrucomicrobiales bacterium]
MRAPLKGANFMTSTAALDPQSPPSNVLVVSQDPSFLENVCGQLGDRGITSASCGSFDDGIRSYDSHRAVIAQIPVGNGGEVSKFVDTLRSQRAPGLPRPLLCGVASGDDIPAFPPGIFDSLLPSYVKVDEVVQRVSDHLKKPAPTPPINLVPATTPRPGARARGGILERILAPQGKRPPSEGSKEETKTVDVPALNALPGEVPETSDDATPTETSPPAFRPAPTLENKIDSPFSLAPIPPQAEVEAIIVEEIETPPEPVKATVELASPENSEPPEIEEAQDELPDPTPPIEDPETSDPPDHYRILVEHAPIALAMFDTEMRYLEANKLWGEAFHLQEIALKGRSQFEVFPGLHPSWKRIYERCLEGKTERSGGDRFRRADGSDDWVRWEVRPWIKDGKSWESEGVSAIGGLVISCEVINGMKQEEQKLEFERSLTGALFSTHTAPVMVVGLDGVVVRANPAARKLAPCEQLVENAAPYWNQLLNGDDRDAAAELFHRLRTHTADPATAPDVPPLLRETLHLASGETNVTWLNIPQRAADGSLQAIVRVGTVTDTPEPEPIPAMPIDLPFSARVIEDEETRETKASPAQVTDLAIPIFTCDEHFVATGSNAAWAATAASASDALTIADAFHHADWPELEAALRDCFETGENVSHHCRLAAATDEETPAAVRVEANPSETGDIIVTVLDDSERTALKLTSEETEKELSAARSEITILEEKLAAAEAKASGMAGAAEELASSHAHQSSDVIPHPSATSLHPATVAAHAPVAFLLLDSDGDLVFANPQHTHLLGTQATEFDSMEDWLADRCTDDDHAENIRETWRDKIWRKQATRVLPLLNADNILKDIRFQPRLLRDGSLLLTLADVTETHRGEQALRISEARLRALFRDCGVPVATVDATGDVSSSTRALETLLGYSAREMRQLSVEDVISGADLEIRDTLLDT